MEDRAKIRAMIEAVLFISAEPVTAADLKAISDMHERDLEEILDEIYTDYQGRNSGIILGKVAGGYQFSTNPQHNDWILKLKGTSRKQKLSMSALESLAIIAYKQPITKAEIEELRGVNSDAIIKGLLDKRLIKIMGKKEVPGKPLLYGTSREFLQYFGLNDLSELPTLKDLQREDAA